MKIGKYMTSALKTGLKKLILAKNGQIWKLWAPIGQKRHVVRPNFFFAIFYIFSRAISTMVFMVKNHFKGLKTAKNCKKTRFPLYFIWEMPAI